MPSLLLVVISRVSVLQIPDTSTRSVVKNCTVQGISAETLHFRQSTQPEKTIILRPLIKCYLEQFSDMTGDDQTERLQHIPMIHRMVRGQPCHSVV